MRFPRLAVALGWLACVCLTCSVSFAQEPKKPTGVGPLPESVKYWVVFRHSAELEKKADDLERRGLDGSGQRALYRTSARLTESQAARFASIATDCVARVAEKDREAEEIIRAARAKATATKGDERGLPPPPPAELAQLQRERDELIATAREDLRRALGDEEFARFQQFVDEKIAPTIRQNRTALPSGGK